MHIYECGLWLDKSYVPLNFSNEVWSLFLVISDNVNSLRVDYSDVEVFLLTKRFNKISVFDKNGLYKNLHSGKFLCFDDLCSMIKRCQVKQMRLEQ